MDEHRESFINEVQKYVEQQTRLTNSKAEGVFSLQIQPQEKAMT